MLLNEKLQDVNIFRHLLQYRGGFVLNLLMLRYLDVVINNLEENAQQSLI